MREPEELVDAFAALMKKELKANEHKGDWREWKSIHSINDELNYHLDKFYQATKGYITTDDLQYKENMKEYAADCGNFLMMMVNAIDGL